MSTTRLHIPLSASGLKTVRLIQAALAGTCFFLFISMGWLWWESQQIETDILEQETAIVQIMDTSRQFRQQAEANGYNLSDQWLQGLPQHVAFAEKLATHQNFSWTQLLNDLESAVPMRISIESVTLDFRNSSIALSGAALNLEDLSALVDRLEQHPAFQQIVLSNHKVQKKKKKEQKRIFSFIAFSLAVTYKPEISPQTLS